MYFPLTTTIALLCAPLFALAQLPNSFIIPDAGLSFTGGQPTDIEWNPTTDGTVTLILRSGSADNLQEGTIIASEIDNSGSFTWTPLNSLTRGSDYALQIVDDANPESVNYTPFFVLDTTTTEEQETPEVTLGAPTQPIDVNTVKPTGDATTVLQVESTEVDEDTPTTPTGAETAASATQTPGSTIPGAATTTDMGATPSAQASGSSGAEEASSASEGAGARVTTVAGMLGVVALGALAL